MHTPIPASEVAEDDQLMAAASHGLGEAVTEWVKIKAQECCPIHANRRAHRHVHDIIQRGDDSLCLMFVTALQRLAEQDGRTPQHAPA